MQNKEVRDYIQKFPYQESHNYAVKYTKRNPEKLNTWVVGEEPELVQAGEDIVVRMNNKKLSTGLIRKSIMFLRLRISAS